MRILVVEDEQQLAELIGRVLRDNAYAVDLAFDGADGLELALSGTYDAIILDRLLPKLDGLALCRQMRQAGVDTPVLFLSALRDLPQRVEGLDSGADDYLGKPFSFTELLARVRAMTRRGERPLLPPMLRCGEVTLDQHARRVAVRDHTVDLSPKEFALLELLLRNAGRVLSRDQILERVWGYDAEPEGNVVDLYVHYLRRKLSAAGAKQVITTVRGSGYTIRERS